MHVINQYLQAFDCVTCVLGLVVALVSLTLCEGQPNCHFGSKGVTFGESCYKFVHEHLSWPEAVVSSVLCQKVKMILLQQMEICFYIYAMLVY